MFGRQIAEAIAVNFFLCICSESMLSLRNLRRRHRILLLKKPHHWGKLTVEIWIALLIINTDSSCPAGRSQRGFTCFADHGQGLGSPRAGGGWISHTEGKKTYKSYFKKMWNGASPDTLLLFDLMSNQRDTDICTTQVSFGGMQLDSREIFFK